MIKKLAFAFLFSATPLLAAQAPDFTVTVDRIARSAVQLTAKPPAGHHINVAAPMEVLVSKQGTRVKPSNAKPEQVVFRAPDLGAGDYLVSLYLCDDHNTYCEKHQVTINWNGQSGATGPAAPAGETAPAAEQAKPAAKPKMLHGFVLNDPKLALEKALRENRPLMIDFFGIWCPPCNMLDEEVFPSADFAKASQGFVKLKLDADSDVSWELKSKYHVTGYPTVVMASPEGDEISRIVGFRPRALFIKEVASAWSMRDQSYVKLKEKADAGDAAAAGKVGQLLLQREDFAQAEAYLAKAADQPGLKEALLNARIGVLAEKAERGDKEAEDKLVETLEQSVKTYPESFDTMDRRSKLADLYESRKQSDQRAAQLMALIALAKKFAAAPEKLAGHDAIPGDLWESIGEAYEKLGKAEEARKAYRSGEAAYGKELARVTDGKSSNTERGYNLERAYCLWKSGDSQAAEKLYAALEGRYPREFTFYYGHARMKYDLRKLEASRVLGLKALQFSYGDNKLRATQLLAKVYGAEKKPAEGLKLVRQALGETKLPADKEVRTNRYYQQLKELEEKLAKQTES